jgi:Helix-turn-helix domain
MIGVQGARLRLPPDPIQAKSMELTSDQAGFVVWLLDDLFKRHGGAVPTAVRQLAVQAALDDDGAPVAVQLPTLMRALPPEVAARVKAQAAKVARSKQDTGQPPISALAAARVAGVSTRAIQSACRREKLTATKDRITGAWRISRPDLAEWMEERRAS